MASLVLLILSAVVVLLINQATAAKNVLLTNQTLHPEQQLSYNGFSLVIHSDCKLVLYNNQAPQGRLINTYGPAGAVNCTLSFTSNGRLTILQPNGTTVWITPNFYSRNGTYAAVVRPDGEVAIYGPVVWSTPLLVPTVEQPLGLRKFPVVRNLLFSGQKLYRNQRLKSGVFSLVMKKDCNLVLHKAGFGSVWQSGTSGLGQSCFLLVGHTGRIAIVDRRWGNTVWDNDLNLKHGEYVLLLQDNGQAVVYGPQVWSTATSGLHHAALAVE